MREQLIQLKAEHDSELGQLKKENELIREQINLLQLSEQLAAEQRICEPVSLSSAARVDEAKLQATFGEVAGKSENTLFLQDILIMPPNGWSRWLLLGVLILTTVVAKINLLGTVSLTDLNVIGGCVCVIIVNDGLRWIWIYAQCCNALPVFLNILVVAFFGCIRWMMLFEEPIQEVLSGTFYMFGVMSLVRYFFGPLISERLRNARWRMVGRLIKTYNTTDDRPDFDRVARRGSSKILVYQICIEESYLGLVTHYISVEQLNERFGSWFNPFFGYMFGIKASKIMWNAVKNRFGKLHISESLLAMAINRKTMGATDPDTANDRINRLMMEDQGSTECFDRLARTGRSVYTDTAFAARMLVSEKFIQQGFR